MSDKPPSNVTVYPGPPCEHTERIAALESEVRELRAAVEKMERAEKARRKR